MTTLWSVAHELRWKTSMNRTGRARLWAFQYRSAPYLFVSPFLVLFAVFLLYPLVRSLILSTYKTLGPRHQIFAGLDNYKFILSIPLILSKTAFRRDMRKPETSVDIRLALSELLSGRGFARQHRAPAVRSKADPSHSTVRDDGGLYCSG